jgi:hypothetical protein
VVIVLSESPEPLLSAGPTAPPKRVKTVDQHSDGVKPVFDVVSLSIVDLTVQFTTFGSSQIIRSTNKKVRIGDIVFPCEVVQKYCRESGPRRLNTSISSSSRDSVSIAV